ncbi:restriction endonuclease subunit S [Ruminococcus sp.]|uniref:restriction endonuclease subunit S n=1 Tax=Ruminococcus sp. TaxID=41978 RepID=UPI00388D4D54
MNKVRLGDYVRIKTGKLDANVSSPDGDYPFFTCAVDPLRINTYSYDCECVLVAGNGDLNVKYYNGKFDAYQRTYIIESIDKMCLCVPYLYRFLDNYIDTLRNQSIGGVIKYIKLGNLTEAPIEIPALETQTKTVNVLSFLDGLIEKANQQKEKMDELIKSRFVEMFGNIELNNNNYPVYLLNDLCNISSSKRIYQSEQSKSGVPFLRISDLVKLIETDIFDNDLFIPIETFEELQENDLVPTEGDILVTSRGTIGKCYIMKKSDRFYFQDGMISWLYSFDKRITPLFLSLLFDSRYIKRQIDNLQSGSTVAYLSIAMLKKLHVVVPPIDLQNQFGDFVTRVEKQKAVVQQSIDKLETLKKSLMQEYFGL